MRVVKGSPGAPLRRAYTANSTDTAFTAPVATTTKPTGTGVIDYGNDAPAWLRVLPFGTGSDNDTFDVRIIGWSLIESLWVPVILCQFSATLSAFVGVAAAAVINTERFADTISDPATGFGEAGVTCQPQSPANDTPGFMLLDTVGCTVFRVDIDRTGATAGNALVGPG